MIHEELPVIWESLTHGHRSIPSDVRHSRIIYRFQHANRQLLLFLKKPALPIGWPKLYSDSDLHNGADVMNSPENKDQAPPNHPGFVHPHSRPPSGGTPIPISVFAIFLLIGFAAFVFYYSSENPDLPMLLKVSGGVSAVLGVVIVWRCRSELLAFFRSLKPYDPTDLQ